MTVINWTVRWTCVTGGYNVHVYLDRRLAGQPAGWLALTESARQVKSDVTINRDLSREW